MIKIINSSVDSLYFSYKGKVHQAILDCLEEEKQKAINISEDISFDDIGNLRFLIKPSGWGKYKYRLDSYGFNLYITDSKSLPSVYVQIIAHYLYELGYKKVYEQINDLMKFWIFKEITKCNLSRIDLCVDFQGWDIKADYIKRIVCKANDESAHGLTKKLQTLTFGKGDIVVRIYNKTIEIKKKSKDWMIEVWKKSELFNEQKDVWRVEVQLRGKILKELQIKSVEDSFNKLKGLWNFGLNWCQIKEIGKDKQKIRWKDDKRWIYLRENALFEGDKEFKRIREIKKEANRYIIVRSLAGYLTTYYAINGLNLFEKGTANLYRDINLYYQRKNTTFEEIIKGKRNKILELRGMK